MFKGGFGLETTPGNLRKTMAHRGMLKQNQKLIGFNEEDLRNAITDETLLGVPKGFGGGMFSEGRPLGALTPSQSRIYNTNNPGKYIGSSQEAPIEIWMPEPFGKIKEELSAKYPKKTGNSLRQDVIGALEKRKEGFYQPVNDRVINNLGYYQEGLKEGRFGPNEVEEAIRYVYSKKEGGPVDEYAAGSAVKKAAQSGLGALKSKKEFKEQFTPGFYHGSPSNKIKEFDSSRNQDYKKLETPGVTFVTRDPDFAESFLPMKIMKPEYEEGATMYPVSVNMGKHFHPQEELGEKVIREYAGNTPLAKEMSEGNWSVLESPDFMEYLKNKGFNSMTVFEGGVPNVAVFDSKNIRGKFAKYNPEDANSADFMKAEGGQIDGYAKGKIVSAAKKLILPPAENAARTQIIGTLPTYEKAANIFQQQGGAGRGIDFGAGLGQGAKALGKDFDTYEPFAQNWKPTYSNAADVPSDEYGRLTNLNVLNVVPREIRDEIVQDIGRVMQPGGMGIITTRGKDVMNAKGLAGPEPMSVITSRDTYQKGFNKDELEEYLKYMLGDKFDINRLNLGPAGALIKKKAEGGLTCMKEGGSTPAWQRSEGKNPEGGLNAAGRASYNRETGGNLKAPQPEGGPRKKSFCARMEGMKKKNTSSATANDPDSRINKSLRKWKC
jgi:hypothetical protein